VKTQLLLYLASGSDPHRCAVGPALAMAAEQAGWLFDTYYDCRRSGRHYGGFDPGGASDALAGGSFIAGGRHLDHALWLTASHAIAAVGDPQSPIWPVIAANGEVILQSTDPAEIFAAVYARLKIQIPADAFVLDGTPQTALQILTAPFLYPRIVSTKCVAIDVSSGAGLRKRLEDLGVRRFAALYVDAERADAFPGGLDSREGTAVGETYATLTSGLARDHAAWGRGTFLGDPDLIAAQLALAVRRRLLPLYGRPQTDVIAKAETTIRAGADPVYGRQFDDRDFFALGRLGRGLQIVDPDPPFTSATSPNAQHPVPPDDPAAFEPDDQTLQSWADEGKVLTTLVLWAGMIRELHCIPRLLDLVAATGLKCGLAITTDTIAHASPADLSAIGIPAERGGVLGQVELLLSSTGRGVCAEAYMPENELTLQLSNARLELAQRLPAAHMPRGWWPLVDSLLEPVAAPRITWTAGGPKLRIAPRTLPAEQPLVQTNGSTAERTPDARRSIGKALRRYRLDRFYEAWRPYDRARPGPLDIKIANAVNAAGFTYMWTKTAFGRPEAFRLGDEFVALPFTAGAWDGWSPFYTVQTTAQIATAENRLIRAHKPGWLASNVDSCLWTMPGEVLEHGHKVYAMAELVARGGRSGRLVNVTPHVIARFARIVAARSAGRR
jgi:hypothetical protein